MTDAERFANLASGAVQALVSDLMEHHSDVMPTDPDDVEQYLNECLMGALKLYLTGVKAGVEVITRKVGEL